MVNDLFLVPFLTGLVLAVLLPLLGCYLRLRDEWLAALAYSHVAAAGALLALVAGLAPVAGGLAAAAFAGIGKRLFAERLSGGAGIALLLIGGWAAAVLLAANHTAAERMGHMLFDGQLYFTDAGQLVLVAGAALGALALLRRQSGTLLLARVYPEFFRVRGLRVWPTQAGFDIVAALCLALGTMSLGVMGAFALVFVPPWLAFRRGRTWRHGLGLATGIGLAAYAGAFFLALTLDQPFGPVLALLLVVLGLVIA
jgi:zinc transport system permease protein